MKWRRGAYDGEMIVEFNATEDPYEMTITGTTLDSAATGCYTTEVGVYDDALLPFP